MSNNICPVCTRYELERDIFVGEDANRCDCPHCGKYSITDTAQYLINQWTGEQESKRPLVSHIVRRMNFSNDRPLLTSDLLSDILSFREMPTPQVQAEYLLHWLGRHGLSPGTGSEIDLELHGAILGVHDLQGIYYVIDGLVNERLLKKYGSPSVTCLTFAGWERYQELERGVSSTNTKAFMAMKFNDAKLDNMLKNYFQPAVESTGFSLQKLDDNPVAGLIDDRMRVEIRLSRFLIADLSHGNAGAYWEAGYAEGLGKPVIYTCEKSVFEDEEKKPHFDTNHHLTVVWDEGEPEKAAEKLKATIRATVLESKMEDG